MKKLRLFGSVLALSIAGLSFRNPKNSIENLFDETSQSVSWGHVAHINSPAKSYGFYGCTAVIFDYGNEALFSHALAGYDLIGINFRGRLDDRAPVNGYNVVERMVEESRKRGLNLRDCEALIDAGNETELRKILEDLNKEGIKVRKSKLWSVSNGTPIRRDVYFNPSRDLLVIRKTE